MKPYKLAFQVIAFFLVFTLLTIPLSAHLGQRAAASANLLQQEMEQTPVQPLPAKPAQPPAPPPQVTLALVGDILLDSWVGAEIVKQGTDYPWVKVKPILSAADLAIGNLESAVGVGGSPIKGKSFTFRAKPETLQGVANAGIDVVSLANNHVLDYGTAALEETLVNLDLYGIGRTGAGRNIYEALTPVIKEVNGLKVGVISFSRVVPYGWWVAGHEQPGVVSGWDNQLVLDTIKQLDSEVDILLVSMHWGTELADYPAKDQVNLAKAMIDNGADVILGHHSHCLQGIEVYQNKPILYSLGNFVFTSSSLKARTGAIALVTMDQEGVKELQMIPTRLDRGQPQVLEGQSKSAELVRLQNLSKPFGTLIDAEGKYYQ
ncbi:CapA family protein [Desulforamulus ferrireducens]|uniref:CapA family protein n=1 Tax=Desulforamulus ferrireducens TaxID=1833852 RepID=UPI00098AFEB9|nr:CapA family protein [Desulforamulus ferrireducens]